MLPRIRRCACSAPFGCAGGAAGVDDQRRIVGRGVDAVKRRARLAASRSPRQHTRSRARRRRRSHAAGASAGPSDPPTGWRAWSARRSPRSRRRAPSGTRARRGRTGATAAARWRPSGRSPCRRSRSPAAAAGCSATRSPRFTPSAASALDRRLASLLDVPERVRGGAPDSSSQYSAKRERSAAHCPQQACAMLKRSGTVPAECPRTVRRSDPSSPAAQPSPSTKPV